MKEIMRNKIGEASGKGPDITPYGKMELMASFMILVIVNIQVKR